MFKQIFFNKKGRAQFLMVTKWVMFAFYFGTNMAQLVTTNMAQLITIKNGHFFAILGF